MGSGALVPWFWMTGQWGLRPAAWPTGNAAGAMAPMLNV